LIDVRIVVDRAERAVLDRSNAECFQFLREQALEDLMQTPNEMFRKPLEFGNPGATPGKGPCLLLG